MLNFNLGSLDNWKAVGIGEVLALEMPSAGFRHVSFDVMASGSVSVNAVAGDDYWLVAHGSGFMSVKFAADRPVGLVFVGDPTTDVFLRSLTEAPVVPESVEASYTTIEPRRPGPSDDVRRMMMMMRLNQERREAQYRDELQRLSRKVDTVETRKAKVRKEADSDPVIEGKAASDDA